MAKCTTCGDMGAVEWPETQPCPSCRLADWLELTVPEAAAVLRANAVESTGNFYGYDSRRCGSHHTCGFQAWCLDCEEWCSRAIPCDGCESELGVTVTEGSPQVDSRDEAMGRAATARREARQFLLAGEPSVTKDGAGDE
jgi:hypothetical protein